LSSHCPRSGGDPQSERTDILFTTETTYVLGTTPLEVIRPVRYQVAPSFYPSRIVTAVLHGVSRLFVLACGGSTPYSWRIRQRTRSKIEDSCCSFTIRDKSYSHSVAFNDIPMYASPQRFEYRVRYRRDEIGQGHIWMIPQ